MIAVPVDPNGLVAIADPFNNFYLSANSFATLDPCGFERIIQFCRIEVRMIDKRYRYYLIFVSYHSPSNGQSLLFPALEERRWRCAVFVV